MSRLADLYRPALGLLTDLYQLTMAQGYHTLGLHEREAVFHLTYRVPPFAGGYAVAAGLPVAADLLQDWHFSGEDVDFLATLTGNDDAPLFRDEFLGWLRDLRFTGDVDTVEEGEVVFPHMPLVRVRAPLAQAQIVETALLSIVNFQTLIATKAARVCWAAGDDPVLEFGLRRAQGLDGGLSASRAAYVGGVAATSNVLAARLFGIPCRGTHAHSWVMVFEDEPAAFAAYAEALPNNCVFLVDTYDTLEGVRRAIEAGRALRARGHRLGGVRLDSGNLGDLAAEARRLLDAAGFPDAAVVASNDLDENRIGALKAAGAPIGVWGVGTRLATGHSQPALGGVYKLAAIGDAAGAWQPRLKLSEQEIKVSDPGVLQVRRWADPRGRPLADQLWSVLDGPPEGRPHGVAFDATGRDLLQPVFRAGARVGATHDLPAARARARRAVASLPPSVRRLDTPDAFPVHREARLASLRDRLIARGRAHSGRSEACDS